MKKLSQTNRTKKITQKYSILNDDFSSQRTLHNVSCARLLYWNDCFDSVTF